MLTQERSSVSGVTHTESIPNQMEDVERDVLLNEDEEALLLETGITKKSSWSTPSFYDDNKEKEKLIHSSDNKEKSEKYDVPSNLLQLVKKKQNAFLALKIIEIMGEDEPYQLDPETIFFITSLLNEMNLIQIRNKVLISALPERV